MCLRMLAAPGGAITDNLRQVPVAADVQVRNVTEYLGITSTRCLRLDTVRPIIQEPWHQGAAGAAGPPNLAGTNAAIEPAALP